MQAIAYNQVKITKVNIMSNNRRQMQTIEYGLIKIIRVSNEQTAETLFAYTFPKSSLPTCML